MSRSQPMRLEYETKPQQSNYVKHKNKFRMKLGFTKLNLHPKNGAFEIWHRKTFRDHEIKLR